MRRSAPSLITVVLVLGLAVSSAEAAAAVRVVTATPDLKALTDAVGGDRVDVVSLVRGTQNAHDVEVRPSLMLKLRHADLLVRNGLGLDYWVEPLLVGAHNARILAGTPGYVDASREVPIISPKGPLDRSRGDVHPEGDPHYTLDPANAEVVTANILDGLKRAAPQHSPLFEARRRDFLARLDAAMADWRMTLAPFRGARVITYHDTFSYFLRRFGLELAGTIEDRPGIPPSPSHLAELIRTIREQKIKVIVAEPWADRKVVELVARDSGARALVLPSSVGGLKGVDSYLDLMGYNVQALAEALR
jgi:zinc/manganese transport system substrate-binding protein